MWYLISPEGKRIYLKPNQEIKFGRKKGDIVLSDDESMSRLHAAISVMDRDFIPMFEPTSICKIRDLNSKYGTYIFHENEMIEVHKNGYILKHQDSIRFGLQQHVFTVINMPIITVASTLNDDDKSKLECLMTEIDGMVFYEWIELCTHLTVSKATLTEKVTCAMACAVPIVTMNYWYEVKRAIDNAEELPDPLDFIAPIGEPLINKRKLSLFPNQKRKTLFQNLTFVHFSTQQYKVYGKIIKMAGGKSLLYSKQPLTTEELCAENIIALQYPNYDATQSTQSILPEYDSVYSALQARRRKMISESEVPLAILHCSIEKYCNPTYRFERLLKRSSQKCDSSEILVLDTQDVTSNVRALPKVISDVSIKSGFNIKTVKQVKIIPETYDDFDNSELLNIESKQLMEKRKPNKPRIIQETKDTFSDTSVIEENVIVAHSKKNIPCIPETKDTFSDTSTIEENLKVLHFKKNTVCIPETNDTFSGTSAIEENVIVPRSKKYTPCIPETKDTFSDISTIEENLKVLHSKKNTVCIPETNDTFSGTSATEENAKVSHSEKNTFCNNETKDTFSGTSATGKNIKAVHPKKNAVCIPETNDSHFSGTLTKNIQCFTHNINNSEKNKNIKENVEKIKESNINKEIINLSEGEDFKRKETRSNANDNNNYNDIRGDRSDDLFEDDISSNESLEMQMMNLPTDIQIAKNHDVNCRIVSPILKENQRKFKNRCKNSSGYDSDEEYITVPAKKQMCSRNLNMENISSHSSNSEVRETSSNFSRYNSSFLRANLACKTFKKVYTNIPKKRISLSDMYVWGDSP